MFCHLHRGKMGEPRERVRETESHVGLMFCRLHRQKQHGRTFVAERTADVHGLQIIHALALKLTCSVTDTGSRDGRTVAEGTSKLMFPLRFSC